MDIMPIVTVVAMVSGVGAFLGAGLAWASQVFHVEVDATVSEAENALPGINCGACGFPGCAGYAEAVVTDSALPTNLCVPGGGKTSKELARITGKSAQSTKKRVSLLACASDNRRAAPAKYDYKGIADCSSMDMMHQGGFTCPFSCVGLGTCSEVCPVHAITMVNGRPSIDSNICTGCGICVKTCPRFVLTLADYPGRVQVYCRNNLPAKVKRKMCYSACIGCTLCVKNCPYGAATMNGTVAIVDHTKCPPDCPRPCVDKCPTAAILARGVGADEKNMPLLKKHRHLLEKKEEQKEEEAVPL